MALAIAAGANLPAVWVRWLLGESPAWCEARPGVRFRWEDAELRHLLWQARRGDLRAALAVLRPRRNAAHAYFRLDDPGPLGARVLELTGMALVPKRRHHPQGDSPETAPPPTRRSRVSPDRDAGVGRRSLAGGAARRVSQGLGRAGLPVRS
jgi:hypothetical protein